MLILSLIYIKIQAEFRNRGIQMPVATYQQVTQGLWRLHMRHCGNTPGNLDGVYSSSSCAAPAKGQGTWPRRFKFRRWAGGGAWRPVSPSPCCVPQHSPIRPLRCAARTRAGQTATPAPAARRICRERPHLSVSVSARGRGRSFSSDLERMHRSKQGHATTSVPYPTALTS